MSSRSCASCRRTASHPGRSSGILGALSCVFTFALRRGYIPSHPFQRHERNERPHPLRCDQRVLTRTEPRATLRRLPAALSAVAAHGGVHGYAALRGAGAELGRHRLRPRLGLRSPPTCARPPRRAARTASHPRPAPLCARSRSSLSSPRFCGSTSEAHASLPNRTTCSRPRMAPPSCTTTSPSACSAGLPAAPASIGRADGCASTICATPSPAT